MRQIEIQRENINLEALDAALRQALGAEFVGVSSGRGQVLVHLTEAATRLTEARQIVEAHDPTVLTPEQQARQERQAQLAALRESDTTRLSLTNYEAEPALIRRLARKIARLELEIERLKRGL